jgi:Na+-translocating ferredoxin:NAD+ oxidoreductase RnfD subunit
VLGQTGLGFELSIAQILTAVLTAGLLEVALVLWRQRRVVWPASGMLTGNGVALLLRVPGTRHGDWWAMRGAAIFAAVAAVSVLSKHVIRFGGRHAFNPSNLGLVACFALLGSRRVDPQDLWWGPPSWALVAAFVVIGLGAVAVTGRLRMLGMAAAYWIVLAAGVAVLAVAGHTRTARWRVGVMHGPAFWWAVMTSPEVFVFAAFMITDPKTSPLSARGRVLFGAAAALAGAALMAPARSEFGV